MTYYKVKPKYDNYRKGRKSSDIYVADELYTEKEVEKLNLNPAFMDVVTVSRKQTYWLFGARFCID